MNRQPSYALVGFLLGWGAPFGALVLRYVWANRLGMNAWVSHEIEQHLLLYLYMTVSTAVAFSAFGAWMGGQVSRLKRRAFLQLQASDTLNELSLTDGLTGLYNHRYLQERLQIELERAQRYQTPLAVVMLDIDDFKRLNDTYGHLFGDHALRHVTTVLLDSVRKIDIVGRYGGEEFLAILPQTSQETALEVAERIRQSVAGTSITHDSDEKIDVTITGGLACVPRPDIKTRAALLQAADDALYEGKRRGKNRVEVSRGREQ